MHGQFHIEHAGQKFTAPNRVFDEGEESFLKMLVRADVTDVAAGGDFFTGLCGDNDADNITLLTLSGEPAIQNGYSRQAISRDIAGWPTIVTAGEMKSAVSLQVTFTPVGGDFSTAINRAFLCNVISGTAGLLFCMSGRFPGSPITIELGTPFLMQYELFLR